MRQHARKSVHRPQAVTCRYGLEIGRLEGVLTNPPIFAWCACICMTPSLVFAIEMQTFSVGLNDVTNCELSLIHFSILFGHKQCTWQPSVSIKTLACAEVPSASRSQTSDIRLPCAVFAMHPCYGRDYHRSSEWYLTLLTCFVQVAALRQQDQDIGASPPDTDSVHRLTLPQL